LINLQKLESDAFRLKDLESLRNLFADLNFEYEDKPVDKQNWNEVQREVVVESKIVARKDSYLVYYIKSNTDSIKVWKEIATKIISANNGLCLVCSHNPSGFQWIFSSISKEFTKSFTETRHIPIEIKPSVGIPRPFLEFLEAIRAEDTDKGINILNRISDAFDRFSLQIHDELTINVFEALKVLSEAIIKSNKLILSNETLDEIREPIFILLYRIIFVLYAEDRSIFPIENKIYHDKFSLKWIKHNWILKTTNQQKLKEYEIQNRLKQLFRLIEVGSEELDYNPEQFFMRSYYGRLFDRKLNQLLEKWTIPNEFFIKAIELVSSTKDKKANRFFLDYAALEIRHLGSIYEHLLEFHLTIKNKKIADLPSPQDRKSTGSYYTPQYVVDYIVTNSIGPVVDKIIKETPSKSQQIEKILSLNILDPAMGSGHFLVGATEYLAKRICEIENKENSTENYMERKRDVVRQCIYGVDLNPLAVDLAALSLWLETLSSEKPLSFLSAHLKVGNSLVGSNIKEIFENQTTLLESEKGRDQFKRNIKDFFMFENLEDDTPSAVKTKIEKYNRMQLKGTIYYDLKFLLDSKLAESFGIKVPALGDFRAKIGENSIDFYTSNIGSKVKEVSEKNRFFHWELEFPNIFFDEKGNRKSDSDFDIIIGNPPYGANVNENEKHFIKEHFKSATGRYDTFYYFIESSVSLLKEGGILGFIVPDTWLTNHQAQSLREILLRSSSLIRIVGLPQKVFPDTNVDTCIIILQKESEEEIISKNSIKVAILGKNVHLVNLLQNVFQREFTVMQKDWGKDKRFLFNIHQTSNSLVDKINEACIPLGGITEMTRGINPYAKSELIQKYGKVKGTKIVENRIWHSDSKKSVEYKKELVGGDIGRYFVLRNGGKWIKYGEWLSRPREPKFFTLPHLVIQRIRNPALKTRIVATYIDPKDEYYNNSGLTNLIIANENYSIKYILTILNSKLINWYYRQFFRDVNIKPEDLRELPIKVLNINDQSQLIDLADRMLKLNKQLVKIHPNMTKERVSLTEEIKKIDASIDALIYELYGIVDDEKKIIEDSLK